MSIIEVLLLAIAIELLYGLYKLATWRDQDNARLADKINAEFYRHDQVGGRVDLDPESPTPLTDEAARVNYHVSRDQAGQVHG